MFEVTHCCHFIMVLIIWCISRSAELSLWAPPGCKQDHQGDGHQCPGPEEPSQVIRIVVIIIIIIVIIVTDNLNLKLSPLFMVLTTG